MPDQHRSPDLCLFRSPGFPSLMCSREVGHEGKHSARYSWDDDAGDAATTLRLPPVRESLGPRRRPPAPLVRELSDRLELLRALVDELAADDQADDDAELCTACQHPRHGRFCGVALCVCVGGFRS